MLVKTMAFAAGAILISALAASASAASGQASAAISGPAGAGGTATLREGPSGVLLRLEVSGLTPGWHAVHFHEKGDCSDPKFASAGGHINHPAAKKAHGLLNADGPDMGDLPNIHVGADGKGQAEVFSSLVSLNGADGRPALLDADGSAIVIHAGPDDYVTQPIGGAGARAACGVIRS
jgi:Cu-Zn family superoxide dismutase